MPGPVAACHAGTGWLSLVAFRSWLLLLLLLLLLLRGLLGRLLVCELWVLVLQDPPIHLVGLIRSLGRELCKFEGQMSLAVLLRL